MYRTTLNGSLLRHFAAALSLACILPVAPLRAQCTFDWLPYEGAPGVVGDLPVAAATAWDPDGPGPRTELLVAGGGFLGAGDIRSFGLAAWDGDRWHSLGALNGRVWSLTVYDGDLIVGGDFTTADEVSTPQIARFDGTTWHAMGSGVSGNPNSTIFAFTEYNGDLIAGGRFTIMDGVTANGVARWDGTSWHALAGGVGATNGLTVVNALTVFEGDLIVGGGFETVDSPPVTADNVARWNGSSWSGINDFHIVLNFGALHVYNGELIASGSFIDPNTNTADFFVRWNGTAWEELGGGTSDHVFEFHVHNGELIAGGIFTNAGGVSAFRIARWNGSNWSSLGFGMRGVGALTTYNEELIVGGSGSQPSGLPSSLIVRWNGSFASYLGGGIDAIVYDLATYNGALVAGGWFSQAGNIAATGIAARGENGWHTLGENGISGLDQFVYDLTPYNDTLIASGSFSAIDGVPTSNGMAQWDGDSWHPFGSVDVGIAKKLVHEGVLYAPGGFGPNQRVARWDDEAAAWQALGTFPPNVGITALTIHNGDLIAGGIGGTGATASVWRWDFDAPGTWHPVGQHLGFVLVQTLAVYNGELLVGGYIDGGIKRFNGASWETFEGGLFLSNDLPADTLAVFDLRIYNDELIVAGSFGHAGQQQYSPNSVTAYHVARWNGTSWLALDGFEPGLNDAAVCLHEHDGDLFIGGWFDVAGGNPVGHLARWGPVNPGDVDGDRDVDLSDLAALLGRFGAASGAGRPDGDLDSDGDVDLGDLTLLLANFGRTCP